MSSKDETTNRNNSICCITISLLIFVSFPFFLTMTILSSKSVIIPCKIVSYIGSSKCETTEDAVSYIDTYYNASFDNETRYDKVYYYCMWLISVSCRLDQCKSNIDNGKMYQCYKPSFYEKNSGYLWKVMKDDNDYRYSPLFWFMLIGCILSGLIWLFLLFITYMILFHDKYVLFNRKDDQQQEQEEECSKLYKTDTIGLDSK